MKEIDLMDIWMNHYEYFPDSGEVAPNILAAMREAVELALDMAADEARVVQLYDHGAYSVSKQSILALKPRIK